MSVPVVATPTPAGVSEHVLGHLTPPQREVALRLATPITIDDIARDLGYSSRRAVEPTWLSIRDRLWIFPVDSGPMNSGTGAALRVALVRILYGIDPCPVCTATR